ncbi:ATPase, F1/V1/A1 complex, alpha/beta subunit, Zinc knuckle CX2CX4HX4C [Artemisia annua]|uniref:ATPase, F1/V1/A1 complex, alpha/beta subunit, Zinc knuckle CX2CX4HX4C n=1 Tax=Artemisia annua TaxID=35608 RepID=A0A2U1N4V3_ARTAN|nr:ATPase, F1/V1/A1 complex, alpha/beta subunit, Zinc knuckle CX2CX4HX4C [Artemisia annua]
MSNKREGNTSPMAEDNSATVDLSKVTVRKHKKARPNLLAENSCDTSPHVQVENCGDHVEPIPHASGVIHDSGIESSIMSVQAFIEALMGVSIKTLEDVDAFTKGLDAGKFPEWDELESDVQKMATEALLGLWEAFEAEHTSKSSHESPIPMGAEPVCEGVNIFIPRKVVEKVSSRLEHTLYGYFIGKRIAFPVVEYYARNNWAKHGLKRIMMNSKGFFFFKFDTLVGVEAVLEGGSWMIRKYPIILKKWSMDTCLRKEELTSIPIWVKLHDVPLQVFEEDGINLISNFIGKPVMLDSYTTSMCKESWGRSSFSRCLIEVNSEVDLVEVVTIGFPSLSGEGFTKENIRVEYEWRPPRCNICKIIEHTHDQCPKQVVSPPAVST